MISENKKKINIVLDKQLIWKLQTVADKYGIYRSQLISILLHIGLEQFEGKTADSASYQGFTGI